jgi:hypothetical protein
VAGLLISSLVSLARLSTTATRSGDMSETTNVSVGGEFLQSGLSNERMTVTPSTSSHHLALNCFRYFYHNDKMNAEVHMASVKFSPITFRLQEYLFEHVEMDMYDLAMVEEVMSHNGTYKEDKGR